MPKKDERDSAKYGYGLSIRDERGVHIVEHGGGRRGFCSHLLMVPEHRFAVIVLANQLQSGRVLQTAVEKAMKLLLPLKPKLAATKEPALPVTQQELDDVAGTYESPEVNATVVENREIKRKGSQLFYKVGGRAAHAPRTQNSFHSDRLMPLIYRTRSCPNFNPKSTKWELPIL